MKPSKELKEMKKIKYPYRLAVGAKLYKLYRLQTVKGKGCLLEN